MAQTRTLKTILADAALAGFASHVNLFDGGQTVTLEQEGTPKFRTTWYWGDEDLGYEAIDNHVNKYRRRREDDPAVQHEPVTMENA